MKLLALVAVGAFAFWRSCIADPLRTEFEQSFIGREWVKQGGYGNRYPLSERCELLGGYLPFEDSEFAVSSHMCEGQRLELFERFMDPVIHKVKVLDAVLLPKFEKGDDLMFLGECKLRGKIDKFFFALVNMANRESVNWKTGVKAAWYPNPKTGKIEELSTRHIVCYEPTPP